MINVRLESFVRETTGATRVQLTEVVQELWSGYGQILRLQLQGTETDSIIAKHIAAPSRRSHPRGWVTDLSHERKLKSYEIETKWYQQWSARCDEACRIPEFLAVDDSEEEVILLLEDLNASGFPARRSSLEWPQIEKCLRWLAEFHATFMGETPENLWETGTYWHLATRPDELKALDDVELRAAAPALDRTLSTATYRTFVHGDAKLANFCFSETGDCVAALDFQYVGGGCGMKDVAYFIGSCLDEPACEAQESNLLDSYFTALCDALARRKPDIDASAVDAEWRALFPVAWTDFHRFLKGWCPGHWKINGYSERLAREVISKLSSDETL